MTDEQRIFITFDEFFKNSSKTFFERNGFQVETEVEIFKLPKKLDVLVVKKDSIDLPEDFTLFRYWKNFNLISFKSKPDSLRISDIWDSIIYLLGFINKEENANMDNTTMSLLVNNHPREFLKKYIEFCKEVEKGVWEFHLNFFKVYLIELHNINLKGLDRLFLGNFSTDPVFYNVLKGIENPSTDSKESKWIDIVKNTIYDRLAGFEKDPNIRRKFMATVYEADITDLVKPHLEKAKQEGKIETAKRMREEGFLLDQITRITGLTEAQLKENGII
jgi:hypothetical protein